MLRLPWSPFGRLSATGSPPYGYVVGCVGGGWVGGTRVRVGGTDVRVGGGEVRVGRTVPVNVARGSMVFAVKVITTTGVTVRVGVRVGVRVAVDVGAGVSDGVGVGAVELGKGPRSAREVSATAVRVPLAFLCASLASGERLDISI